MFEFYVAPRTTFYCVLAVLLIFVLSPTLGFLAMLVLVIPTVLWCQGRPLVALPIGTGTISGLVCTLQANPSVRGSRWGLLDLSLVKYDKAKASPYILLSAQIPIILGSVTNPGT